MNKRILMSSTTAVIQKPQSNNNKDKNNNNNNNQTLVLQATRVGKTTFQVKSLLKGIDLLKQK